jgi:hypothetical protein
VRTFNADTLAWLHAIISHSFKALLGGAALILSIVNGLILVSQWWRDRAKLTVDAVHPDLYQWWFSAPGGEYQGNPTRTYGFLIYVSVKNSGIRAAATNEYRLWVKNRLKKWHELRPMNIPEPNFEIMPGQVKLIPVLGQITEHFNSEQLVQPGDSTSGMACYLYQAYGGEGWNPQVESDGTIVGKFTIRTVFGKKSSCTIVFTEKSLDFIRTIIPGLQFSDEPGVDPNAGK